MRMSEGVEWAIHCCSFLASLPEGETLTGASLAEFFDVPRAYLLKHLQALGRAGILESTSGPRGGYRLGRRPADISLLDIVEVIEGGQPAFRCSEIRGRGPSAVDASEYSLVCGIAAAMWQAEEAWRAALAATTLADIGRMGSREVPRRQRELAREWMEHTIAARRR
ncbi:MAG: Rrf2 family transcriptional regulator [Dehalococcoidia bacterium]|nr:Rrf2 family transcriptional regulator [Dehalococcoidia bacterium]